MTGVDDNTPYHIDLTPGHFTLQPDIIVSLNSRFGSNGVWACRGTGNFNSDEIKVFAEGDNENGERQHVPEQFAWCAFNRDTEFAVQ